MVNPEAPVKGTPRDIFLYLGLAFALYIGFYSLVEMQYSFIDLWFANESYGYAEYHLTSVRWLISALVVIFPLFMWLTQTTRKDFTQNYSGELRTRKWFLYLTLFLSTAIVAGDIVYLLYRFLEGDLITQFFLKSFVLLFFGILVFTYYLLDLQGRLAKEEIRFLTGGISLIVVMSLGVGFYLVGTPGHQRDVRYDSVRVQNLQVLEDEIMLHYTNKNSLPSKLEERSYSKDPQTQEQYRYRAWNQTNFELCANFKTVNNTSMPYTERKWAHDSGLVCFMRTATSKP